MICTIKRTSWWQKLLFPSLLETVKSHAINITWVSEFCFLIQTTQFFHFSALNRAIFTFSRLLFVVSPVHSAISSILSSYSPFNYQKGRLRAIQLDYTTAHRHLLQANRKAPQGAGAPGFQQSVHKLSILVQLLMGEIPERSVFRNPVLRKHLLPYFHLVQGL